MHAGRAQDGKFFVRATECGGEAHELNQLKNRKTRGCGHKSTETWFLSPQICARSDVWKHFGLVANERNDQLDFAAC